MNRQSSEESRTPSAFDEILRAMVDRIPGATGAVLADAEGEAVGQFAFDLSATDIQLVGAQWSAAWAGLDAALAHARQAAVDEILVRCTRVSTLLRRVADGYHLVVVLRPDANLGFARREIERGLVALRGEMD